MNYCLTCGKPIKKRSHKKGIVPKYCDKKCYEATRTAQIFTTTVCQYCGKVFHESQNRPNTFCSKKCSSKFYGERRAAQKLENEKALNFFLYDVIAELEEKKEERDILTERLTELQGEINKLDAKINRTKICKECGTIFTGESASSVYCSDKCSRKADNRRKEKRLSKNGKPDHSITLTKLYMRDLGVCQICNKIIDFDCDPNSDDYPSVDHIKPISKGGLHQWDNVQLACRGCNTAKGANEDYIPAPH